MLQLRQISKTYHPKKGKKVQALQAVNLSFNTTGLVFILGKSGSGKSTLMHIIGGLDTPDQGEMILYDKHLDHMSAHDYDSYRNTMIGFVFQEFNLIESFSVYKNIALAVELQGLTPCRETIASLLQQLDIEDEIDRMPYELSGGQKQRVSIARALIKSPKIILADEPTGSLDSQTGKQIFEVLKRLSSEKLVIVVSHDREYAQTYGDRIIELSDGEVIHDSAPVELSSQHIQSFELKRPKMPFKDAFSLGFSAFIRKPVRMLITLFLLIFAFTLYGIFDSSANYDINEIAIHAAYEQNQSVITLSRAAYNPLDDYYQFVPFNIMHFNQLKSAHPTVDMKEVYMDRLSMDTVYNPQNVYGYYSDTFTGLVAIDASFLEMTSFTLIGTLPDEPYEVVISRYMAENYIAFGYDDLGKVEITEVTQLIGKRINTNTSHVIVGIVDTQFQTTRYLPVLDRDTPSQIGRMLQRELWMIHTGSPHTYLYVRQEEIDQKTASNVHHTKITFNHVDISTYTGTKGSLEDMNNSLYNISYGRTIKKTRSIPEGAVLKANLNQTELTGNQVLVSIYEIEYFGAEEVKNDFHDLAMIRTDELINLFAADYFDTIKDQFDAYSGVSTWEDYAHLIKSNRYIPFSDKSYDEFVKKAEAEIALSIYDDLNYFYRLRMQRNISELEYVSHRVDVDVVGYHLGVDTLVAHDFYEEIIEESHYYDYRQVILALSGNPDQDVRMLKTMGQHENYFELYNEISFVTKYVNDPIIFIAQILLWIGMGLGIFSALLFYNFMTISIQHKKKDIGILRALGARQKDVFTIFFSEAWIISLIVSSTSILLAWLMVKLGDQYIMNYFGIQMSILWLTMRQVWMVSGMMFVVALCASWIPIHRFSKEKPIDIIKVI